MKKKLVLFLATLMCISLCACGGSESSSGNNTDTKKEENGGLFKTKKEIEITMDNWEEYFEIKYDIETVELQKNAFDEIEGVQLENSGTKFCLKEEYIDNFVSANIAVEIVNNQAVTTLVEYNLDSNTYEAVEYFESDMNNLIAPFYESVFNESNRTFIEEVTDIECELRQNDYEFDSIEENVLNIYVLMYPNCEVTRIQGSLVIKE